MRLPVSRAAALSLVTLVAACGGGDDNHLSAGLPPAPQALLGPAGDYPVVIGQPFVVDGVTYTPQDKLNYDQVGYAGVADGEGVTISHRTLPLPSYAEVTSLETGRTILVRVTRRGPMTGARLIDLSPAAAAQLGAKPGVTPIRIRRVNPPEQERAMLRAGGQAPARMDTPKGLVAVLVKKLQSEAGAPLAAASPLATPKSYAAPKPVAVAKRTGGKAPARRAGYGPDEVSSVPPSPQEAYSGPEPADEDAPASVMQPSPISEPAARPAAVAPPAPAPQRAAPIPRGAIVIQVGAFSNRDTAVGIAEAVGGRVSTVGNLFRVRIGPFRSEWSAGQSLAKIKAAGYSDARIQHAD